MNFSEIFIRRPVATTLLSLGVLLAGLLAFNLLPVSPLPEVEFPVIQVRASLPGANPENMASSVATPLERSLGRIAGVNEITSTSSEGSTRIVLQFDLSRNINSAARDVQAAINAARPNLPSDMPSLPSYQKLNPADAPIMVLTLTSEAYTKAQIYDVADTLLSPKLAQIEGVGEVSLGGGSQPAIRVTLNPMQLSQNGLNLESVRSTISNNNINYPKGFIENESTRWQVGANDQLYAAADYEKLIIHHQNGSSLRIADVGEAKDSVLNRLTDGRAGLEPAVIVLIYRQPGANIIQTVDRVTALLPELQAQLPAAMRLSPAMDRSVTIRASLKEVMRSLVIAVVLVITVVFLFLGRLRAMLIPAIAVPVSLIGTFAFMYLAGYSLNNLSLMALTIVTGFVVDDAIVVLENITRHIEEGQTPLQAALRGAKEVSFTVFSISLSLIAVFLPILLMGGLIGRLFREFAMTLSVAIFISLIVSLSTTPMLCARWLGQTSNPTPARKTWGQSLYIRLEKIYARSLRWTLSHKPLTLLLLMLTIGLNVYLYITIPKGFFPQQDTGRLFGNLRADQNISFQAMQTKLQTFIKTIKDDPAVEQVIAFTGSAQRNSANMFIALKPLSQRTDSADEVIGRLRKKLSHESGATLFLQAVQEIRAGGRPSNAQHQYTLKSDNLDTLREWSPKVLQTLQRLPELADVNADQEEKSLQTELTFNRDAMAKLGITQQQINAALYNAFGQRQVSTLYNPMNQYKLVMELAPEFTQSPAGLNHIYLNLSEGAPIPLSALATWAPSQTTLSVNHQDQFVANTLSFNLPPDVSLSDATRAIEKAIASLGLPSNIYPSFEGSSKLFKEGMSKQPILILAALFAVYLVLGILYESLIHPLTILSTLPSAGVGALLALFVFKSEFSVIALIGILLLVGIVKKNAIMMIDFALSAQRTQNLDAESAIYQACLKRFRPILMTTLAALFGALPLAFGHGDGAELRVPLGISIVGGLIFSQLLTLYTTPVVFIYLERLRTLLSRIRPTLTPKQVP